MHPCVPVAHKTAEIDCRFHSSRMKNRIRPWITSFDPVAGKLCMGIPKHPHIDPGENVATGLLVISGRNAPVHPEGLGG